MAQPKRPDEPRAKERGIKESAANSRNSDIGRQVPTEYEPISTATSWGLQIENRRDIEALVALSTLPSMTPKRLRQLTLTVSDVGSQIDITPSHVLHSLRAQQKYPPQYKPAQISQSGEQRAIKVNVWARLCDEVQKICDADVIYRSHIDSGIDIAHFASANYPKALLDDPDPPVVLYRSGHELDDTVRVAIVGTRRCSRYGRQVTERLAGSLSADAIPIVSGLAEGIDSVAHKSALETNPNCRPVAVVAGGLDHIYPKHNYRLWQEVANSGTILSEWPLQTAPKKWSFPARNRLIAALSAAVIVVETKETGGSIHTVTAALERNRSVFCVPGSIFSPVSKGCNKLISEGAHPLFDLEAVSETLAFCLDLGVEQQSFFTHTTPTASTTAPTSTASTTAPTATASTTENVALSLSAERYSDQSRPESWLLEVVGWEPVTFDELLKLTSRSTIEVVSEVEIQIAKGSLVRSGSVIQRVT